MQCQPATKSYVNIPWGLACDLAEMEVVLAKPPKPSRSTFCEMDGEIPDFQSQDDSDGG